MEFTSVRKGVCFRIPVTKKPSDERGLWFFPDSYTGCSEIRAGTDVMINDGGGGYEPDFRSWAEIAESSKNHPEGGICDLDECVDCHPELLLESSDDDDVTGDNKANAS